MIRFAHWQFLLLIPFAILFYVTARKSKGLRFSSVKLLRSYGGKTYKHKIGKIFILTGLVLSLIALARPQSPVGAENIRRQGIDIVMILDVSGSMLSVDFEPNRLEVARKTADDFIAGRSGDRVSLVIFAGTAFTRIPLTLDHNVVRESLANAKTESIGEDGTAIGMAVSVGLNRLKKSAAASRVMVLLTDGDNNAGAIDPMTAAKLAAEMGVKIYTVGVGSDTTLMPVQGFGRTQYRQVQGGIDEKLLNDMAELTGGLYFRARDAKSLSRIFETIDRLEKTDFEDTNYKDYNELAYNFIKAALVLLAAGIFLDKFYFVQIP